MGQAAPLNMRQDLYRGVEAGLQFEDYTVKRIRLTEKEPIPAGIDALIVLAPDKMTSRQRYEISAYLHNGGKVVLAAQNYTFDYKQNQYGTAIFPKRGANQVNDLIGGYGVSLDDRILMDDSHEMINVSSNAGIGPVSVTAPVKVPIQIRVHEGQMNPNVSITGGLPSVVYLWGSALVADDQRFKALGLRKTVLFSSSPVSWLVMPHGTMLTREDITSVGRTFDGPYPLALMLEGTFPDVFADKPVPEWEETPASGPLDLKKETPQIPAGTAGKPGTLVVVGCVKMFEESLLAQNGSLPFLTNATDVLTLGGELINIRNHRLADNRIKPLSASTKLKWRFMVVLLVPLGIALFGVARILWRRKEKAMYLEAVRKVDR